MSARDTQYEHACHDRIARLETAILWFTGQYRQLSAFGASAAELHAFLAGEIGDLEALVAAPFNPSTAPSDFREVVEEPQAEDVI